MIHQSDHFASVCFLEGVSTFFLIRTSEVRRSNRTSEFGVEPERSRSAYFGGVGSLELSESKFEDSASCLQSDRYIMYCT